MLIPDNFLFSVPPPGLVHPELLAAAANLSWTHVMAEVFGRRAGGDGILQTYVGDLNRLPIPDIRRFSQGEAEDFLELFGRVAQRPVLPVSEEMRDPDRQAFDNLAMRLLIGQDEAQAAAEAVERALRDLTYERTGRAESGRLDPCP